MKYNKSYDTISLLIVGEIIVKSRYEMKNEKLFNGDKYKKNVGKKLLELLEMNAVINAERPCRGILYEPEIPMVLSQKK